MQRAQKEEILNETRKNLTKEVGRINKTVFPTAYGREKNGEVCELRRGK